MAGIFGNKQATQSPAISGLQLQTSAYGKAIPWVFGVCRIAPNLVWYGNFQTHNSKQGKLCVTGETLIETPDGARRIDSLRVGEAVLAFDPAMQGLAIGTISAVHAHPLSDTEDALLQITRDDGRSLRITANHDLWQAEGGRIAAGALVPGDALTLPDGSLQAVRAIETLDVDPATLVYTLTVEPWHTYIAEQTVVHNLGGGSSGSGPTYTADVIWGLCIGQNDPRGSPTTGFGPAVWTNQTITSSAKLGIGYYNGAAWPYLYNTAPAQALNYNDLLIAVAPSFQLGSSASLPNLNFQIACQVFDLVNCADTLPITIAQTVLAQVVGVQQDQNILGANGLIQPLSDWVAYAPGGSAPWAVWQDYALCCGLFMSIAYTDQTAANTVLSDLTKYTNSEWVWSNGKLYPVPRGAVPMTYAYTTREGAALTGGYTPPPPVFDLTDDHFQPNVAGGGSGANTTNDPVVISRTRLADQNNVVTLEWIDRANMFAPAIAEVTDQGLLERYGRVSAGSQSAHLFADKTWANNAAQLLLQKEYIRRTFAFTLDARFIVLDPMDIVTLTDRYLGLNKFPVRITEITEDTSGTGLLAFIAEEIPEGMGAPANYAFGSGGGFVPNTLVDPGSVNKPILFAAPTQLTGGALQVWGALSGPSLNWGGAHIWVSTDGGASYQFLGTQNGAARMGMLNALPISTDPDLTDQPSVNLSESFGALDQASTADADAARTLSIVDGEFISYAGATLTGPYTYTLSYLRRGLYGSAQAVHSKAPFARLDSQIFAYPYTAAEIGLTVYLKFTSFNLYQAAEQSLADVVAYPYVIGASPDAHHLSDTTGGGPDWTDTSGAALNGFLISFDGLLVPDSLKLASAHSNAELFTQFVPYPVVAPSYTTGIIDLGVSEPVSCTIRVAAIAPGRTASNATLLDAWISNPEPNTFVAFSTGTLTDRFFRARVVQDTSVAPSYITALAFNVFT